MENTNNLPAYVIRIDNQDEADRVVKAAKAKGYVMDETFVPFSGNRKRWCDYSREEDKYFHTASGGCERGGFYNHDDSLDDDQPLSLSDFEAFCYGNNPLGDLPVLGEGVEAWVWDDDPNYPRKEKVAARSKRGSWIDEAGNCWKNASLTDPRQVTVTIQEIAYWKGVEPDQITIKCENGQNCNGNETK